MKKIIFINQYTTTTFADVVNAFVAGGYRVILITGEIAGEANCVSGEVTVIKGPKYRRSTIGARIFTWIVFFAFCFFVLLFKPSYRQLFLVSNPPLTGFLGLFFRTVMGKRYSLLIYDIYPDVLVEFDYVKREKGFIKWWSAINRKIYSRAQAILTISESMKRKIHSYTDREIHVVYNWADSSFIKPISKKQNWFVEQHGLQDHLTIMYSGNFGITHDLETLVEVAREVQQKKHFKFVLIGEGAKKQKLENMVRSYGLQNVTILPFQDFDVLPYSMTAADIGVVTLKEGAESLSVPSKTYYMLAAGCFLLCIATANSELYQLVTKYQVGRIFFPGDVEGIKNFLLSIKGEDLLFYRQNSRKTSELFTPENANKYLEIVEKSN